MDRQSTLAALALLLAAALPGLSDPPAYAQTDPPAGVTDEGPLLPPYPPPAAAPAQPAPAAAPPPADAAGQPAAPSAGGSVDAAADAAAAPDVQSDAPGQPTPQGTRAPRPETTADTGGELYPLLARVRQAPPAIDGTPQPRPNAFASMPTKEMQPDPRGNPESLFPEGYVE
jgi:hypothetical protein